LYLSISSVDYILGELMTESKPQTFIQKICLVGDPEVGKTSLMKRFVLNQFDGDYIMTMGAKVMKKIVKIEKDGQSYNVTLLVWDIMGQKHFRIIESVAFENVVGGLVICDVTRRSTFENLEYWVEAVHRISPGIPMILLANKSDLENERQVSNDELKLLADKFALTWFQTSAKTGDNVDAAYLKLAEHCLGGANIG
jgi:Ras-related protein Rab-8A